jgi:hypothetical protein
MSLRVGLWTNLADPERAEQRSLVVESRAGVEALVRTLADPTAYDACLDHGLRPPDAHGQVDHNVTVAVRGGWGYLHYVDNQFQGWPKGDPRSPAVDEQYTGFPAGTGLPLDRYTEVLVEFLDTATLPVSVEWYDEAELPHPWRCRRN